MYGGIINEDYAQEMNGLQAVKIYDEMRKSDGTVAAAMSAVKMPIRRADFFVVPVDEKDARHVEVSTFISRCLFEFPEISWDDFLRQVLLELDYGVMPFEKVFDIRDIDGVGYIIWKKFAPRLPKSVLRWEIDGENGKKEFGIEQQRFQDIGGANPQIPGEKLLIFVNNKEGDNWWGVSTLRPIYKHWYMKKKLEIIDAMAHERQGLGVPVVKIPAAMSKEDRTKARNILRNIRADHEGYAIVPMGIELEFMDMHASNTKDSTDSINYHNHEIMLSVLAQFLLLGASTSGGSGSRAVSEDHSRLFLQSLEAVAKQICDVINKDAIPELVRLNFPDVTEFPKLDFTDISRLDLVNLANTYKTLCDAGAIKPIRADQNFLRNNMNLPERTEEDDLYDEEQQRIQDEKTAQEMADQLALAQANKGVQDPANEKVTTKKKVIKEVPVNANDPDFDEHYFNDISSIVDNSMILALQNEVRTPEGRRELKKKGLRFNSFEDQASRPLTFAERKVDLQGMQDAITKFEQQLEEKITEITAKQKADLMAQVKRAVEGNDINALGDISVKYKGELAQAITEVQKQMFEFGKKSAANEMGIEPPSTAREVQGAMRVQNDAIIDKIAGDMEADVKLTASQSISRHGGSITATGAAEALSSVSTVLDKRIDGAMRTVQAIATTGSVNLGRGSVFAKYPEKVYAFQYSAILDRRTTDLCRSLDGRIVKPGSGSFYNYSPPQHYNCRSMWVEILNDEEFKPDIDGIPSSIPASSSIGDYQKMKGPEILADSPAAKLVQQELDDRRAKLKALQESDTYPNRQKQHQDRITELEKALKKTTSDEYKEYILKSMSNG